MKILLLSPPIFPPYGPYLALPTLKAFLVEHGYCVEQKDVNLEFFDRVLSRGYLTRCYNEIRDRAKISHYAPFVIKKIDSAREIIKAQYPHRQSLKNFILTFKKLWAIVIVRLGLNIINARYYPAELTFAGIKMKYAFRSSADILQAVRDREENPFIDFFEKYVVPEISNGETKLAGISINDQEQVIPGLTLAKLIKDKGIYVAIGGIIFTKEIKLKKEFFQLSDSFIINEGEHALLELARQLEGKKNFHNVPNLIWYDENKQKIVHNNLDYAEDLDILPTPDFDDLPLNSYFNFFRKGVDIPLYISKGCYWNKCAFCDIGHDKKYRIRKITAVINDIKNIINRHKVNSFLFTSQSLSPVVLKQLSKAIINNGINIKWEGLARFEEDFTEEEFCNLLVRSGCRKLYMGLESTSQRILDFMEKGTRMGSIVKILHNFHKAGIALHLFVLIGLPTQTRQEIEQTFKFILNNRRYLDHPRFSIEIGTVWYSCHSRMFFKPDQFGIKKIRINIPSDDLETRRKYSFIAPNTLTIEEARGLAQMGYRLIENRFFYFSLTQITSWKYSSKYIFVNFCSLFFRIIRHKINCIVYRLLPRQFIKQEYLPVHN
ncbi:MAG: radical SAM protein [Candidatus Omnitrophota bacterium]